MEHLWRVNRRIIELDDLLQELDRMGAACSKAAAAVSAESHANVLSKILEAVKVVDSSASGSWLGYQANVYTVDLRPRLPGQLFDQRFGLYDQSVGQTRGPWAEYDSDAVRHHTMSAVGKVKQREWERFKEVALTARTVFQSVKDELIPTIDAVLQWRTDPPIGKARERIASLGCVIAQDAFMKMDRPVSAHTADPYVNPQRPIQVPPHLQLRYAALEAASCGTQANKLADEIQQLTTYLRRFKSMQGNSRTSTGNRVFIGHGRSKAWQDLKTFLQDRLMLEWEEFNREATAGVSTKERLEEMLGQSGFAFLVMTAEDELENGRVQARANVIHETGLFQGRLGFKRAIILMEEGCDEFTNIVGLTQIRFPPGNIMAVSEEIRRVLEREGILNH